jgi:rhodanese-related sulfurtransferase
MSVGRITPVELDALGRRQAVELIDVRTPAEFREMHVGFARSIPLDTLDPREFLAGRGEDGMEPIYIICRSGARAKEACGKFVRAGCDNVVMVDGGTLGWEQAGLPLVRGPRTISLERQVRIAAGSLVLLGACLGAFVHPALIGIAALVGAGLVFAGITDTCGMALLLARMPWNQVQGPVCACVEPESPSVGVPPGANS